MKFTFQQKYNQSDFAGTGFSPKLIQNYSSMTAQLLPGLNGGLGLKDNFNAGVIQNQTVTHNTLTLITNPLTNQSTPLAVEVISNTQPIESYQASYDSSTKLISLTVNYGLSEQWCFVRSTTTQSITNATGGTVTFNTTPVELVGSNISVSASVLTFAVAGRYLCSYQMSWAANATGDRFAYMLKNGSSRYAQLSGYALGGGVAVNQASSAVITAVAGDTLLLEANQTSGGALNTTSTPFPYLQATQLSIAAGAISDTPTVIVWGG